MHFDSTISLGNILTIVSFIVAMIIDRIRLERRMQAIEDQQTAATTSRIEATTERHKIIEQLTELTLQVARLEERIESRHKGK